MGSQKTSVSLGIPTFVLKGAAACASIDPEMFFPVEVEDSNGKLLTSSYPHLQQAKSVCGSCELKFDCLQYALENVETGIWGGTTEHQRRSLRRGRMRLTT